MGKGAPRPQPPNPHYSIGPFKPIIPRPTKVPGRDRKLVLKNLVLKVS